MLTENKGDVCHWCALQQRLATRESVSLCQAVCEAQLKLVTKDAQGSVHILRCPEKLSKSAVRIPGVSYSLAINK